MKNKKIKRGFLKENKKGVSNILAVILIILIVLMMLVILWNIIKSLITTQSEISMIKAKLIGVDIGIEDVGGDLLTPKQVNLTIQRGPGKIIVKNVSINRTVINVDVISVVDLSGSMLSGNKMNSTKDANRILINKVLNISENQVGFVAYSGSYLPDYSQSLSGDLIILNETINSWVAYGGTCICCGIIEAMNQLENSDNIPIMIVMSDGVPGTRCSAELGTVGDLDDDGYEDRPTDHAIQAAKNAFEDWKIPVYSIGFGEIGFNELTLQKIAEYGGGDYSFASLDNIEEVYGSVSDKIIKTYGLEDYDHLKIMFYNDSDQYEYRLYDMPFPLETKTYVIPNITLEGFELSDKITNITRIEIYQVVTTLSGEPIIGPLLDSWKIG